MVYIVLNFLLSNHVHFAPKCRETDEKSNATSSAATEMREMDTSNTAEDQGKTDLSSIGNDTREGNNSVPIGESHPIDSHASEAYVDPSNVHVTTGVPNEYSYSQSMEGYNHLLTEYYELEEKRQKVLQQLQAYGAWNYQNSGEGIGADVQWGSTTQEHTVGSSTAPYPTVICSCCPYVCPYMNAPCSSAPPCCVDVATSETFAPENSVPDRDNNIVNTAAEAAKKAISSMMTESCSVSSKTEGTCHIHFT